MSQKVNETAARLFLGANIFSIVAADVDATHKSKNANERIEVKAKLYTLKTTEVNEVKRRKAPGGADVAIINGGADAITMPLTQTIINDASKYNAEELGQSPQYFGDYDIAADFCNAGNTAEIIRLETIIEDAKAQVVALKDVVAANDRNREFYRVD